jgi:hypothetical protein
VLRAVRAEIVARNKAEAAGELEAETWRP